MTKEQLKAWVAAYNGTPVWRDGLDSIQSYLIIGTMKASPFYTCCCVRDLDSVYKVKFYPSFEAWGLTEEVVKKIGGKYFLSRAREENCQYERFCIDKHRLPELLALLMKMRGVATVKTKEIAPIMESKLGRFGESIKLHPTRGPGVPGGGKNQTHSTPYAMQ